MTTFDAEGKLVEIKLPPDMQALAGLIRQMIGSGSNPFNIMPATTLAIGESTSVPFNMSMALPVPGAGAPGGSAGVQGQTTLKLLAIEQDGPDRIARFEHTTASIVAVAMQQMNISGSGTMDVNVERGFVKASAILMMLDGTFTPPGGIAPVGPMKMHGTVKMTVAGAY